MLSVERDPKPTPGPTSTTAEMPPPTPAKTGSLLGNALTTRAAPVRTPSSAANAAGQSSTAPPLSPTGPSPAQIADNKKKNRFSMDWFASSLFKGSSAGTDGQNGTNSAPVTGGTSAPAPGLKPMRLTGGPPQRTPTAEEDDEDRKTRARVSGPRK